MVSYAALDCKASAPLFSRSSQPEKALRRLSQSWPGEGCTGIPAGLLTTMSRWSSANTGKGRSAPGAWVLPAEGNSSTTSPARRRTMTNTGTPLRRMPPSVRLSRLRSRAVTPASFRRKSLSRAPSQFSGTRNRRGGRSVLSVVTVLQGQGQLRQRLGLLSKHRQSVHCRAGQTLHGFPGFFHPQQGSHRWALFPGGIHAGILSQEGGVSGDVQQVVLNLEGQADRTGVDLRSFFLVFRSPGQNTAHAAGR